MFLLYYFYKYIPNQHNTLKFSFCPHKENYSTIYVNYSVTVTETRKLVNISLDKTALSVSTKATNYTTGSVVVKGVEFDVTVNINTTFTR